nr:hypothetical protein L204_06486 [Cryptococcus depauperatus CBS 7855]
MSVNDEDQRTLKLEREILLDPEWNVIREQKPVMEIDDGIFKAAPASLKTNPSVILSSRRLEA